MQRFGGNVDPRCSLCGDDLETHTHLFFECRVSRQILEKVMHRVVMHRVVMQVLAYSLDTWIECFSLARSRTNVVCQVRAAALCTCIYGIWTHRNRVVFNGQSVNVEACSFRIFSMLRYRLLAVGIRRNRHTDVIGSLLRLW